MVNTATAAIPSIEKLDYKQLVAVPTSPLFLKDENLFY